jgi:hypothetical protein
MIFPRIPNMRDVTMKWTRNLLATMLAIASSVPTEHAQAADESVFVGDTPAYVGDQDNAASPVRSPATPTSARPRVAPASHSKSTPFASQSSCDTSCDTSCDAGCDSMGGGKSPFKLAAAGCGSGGGWANVDFAFWAPQAREMQPIITAADPGFAPLPGSPGFRTVFGNEIDPGMRPGVKFDVGKYFGPGQLLGFGARGFYMDTSSSSAAIAAQGTDISLGRYFFDARSAPIINRVDNAIVMAAANDGGTDPVFTGAARAESNLDYYGAELYGRVVLGRDKANQLDLLGGYSVASIQDSLLVDSVTAGNPNNFFDPQPDQTVGIRDWFDASNVFQGGHIGADAKLGYGRWHFDMVGKIHLGNMNQQVSRVGLRQTVAGAPGLNGFPDANAAITPRGVLITQNQGIYERNTFTFAPEMNFKIGFEVIEHCMLSVGYSFIYWDSVALADNQIDNIVDPFGLIGVPAYQIQDSGFWFQSLNLGLTVNY